MLVLLPATLFTVNRMASVAGFRVGLQKLLGRHQGVHLFGIFALILALMLR